MKLTVLQENLAKSVNIAARFASSRAQLPILGNILLKANKTKLTIASTNLEISVSTEVGAKIEEEGEITIPAKVLGDIISNLPRENVNLESDKEQLNISTSNFSSKLLGMNSADFPKVPHNAGGEGSFNLKSDLIIDCLSKVLFSTSSDETRPVLTGVVFLFGKESLTVVATDGFRLSRKIMDYKSVKENKVIVPKTVLNELMRLGVESEDIVMHVEEKDKQIVFGLTDSVLTSRLIEGDYPDYEKIIPGEPKLKVYVDKEDMVRAVKLASVFAKDSSNIAKIKINTDSLVITAESGSSGSQEAKVDARVDGEVKNGFEIAFNYHFLDEFLKSVKGNEVEIDFTTEAAAGVFRDSSDLGYLHLIMPVKIQV